MAHHIFVRRGRMAIAALAIWSVGANLAWAGAFSYSIDFDKLGKTMNFACGGRGACGAVSSINSFAFLQKQYPGVYDNKLLPNNDGMTNTDPVDSQKFGFDGWQVGANPMRKGYYNRTGTAEGDFLDTKMDWINDYAPGTTVFNSWWPDSPHNKRKPTIDDLAAEIRDGEDVEFFVQGENFYHVMTLTQVACDMAMMCSIRYQDPNQPGTHQGPTPVTAMDGMLMFTGVPGSNFAGKVTITAAFAESPIPEPGTMVLIGVMICGLALVRPTSCR